MTRRPITPIKEQGRFIPKRKINPNEKLEETLVMVACAILFYPLYVTAKFFGYEQ